MSHLLFDRRFLDFLDAADRDLAEQARQRGCRRCGGPLHSANYWRRPRGGPHRRALRLSWCCAQEGCRRRETPASVRFLARRVYLAVVVVLASMLRCGPSRQRIATLCESLGVSERTLVRWRHWWLRDFASSAFWRAARGVLGGDSLQERLPACLVERFGGDDASRMRSALSFLCPIGGGKGLLEQAF